MKGNLSLVIVTLFLVTSNAYLKQDAKSSRTLENPVLQDDNDGNVAVQILKSTTETLGDSIKKTSKAVDDALKTKRSNSSTPVQVTHGGISDNMHSQENKPETKHMKRRATIEDYLPGFVNVLVFTSLCVASFYISKIMPYFGLPLVSGYLLVGIFFGPYVLGLISESAIRSLRIVDEVALAFIAFCAGAQLYFKKLRERKQAIQLQTIFLCLATFIMGTVTLFTLHNSVSFMHNMNPQQILAIAMIGGTLLVARSPASAIAIKKELNAEGPFTSTIMGTTIITDVVVITLFALIDLVANGMLNESKPNPLLLGVFAAQMVISIIIGVFFGICVLPNILIDEEALYNNGEEGVAFADKAPAFAKAMFRAASYLLTLTLGFMIFFSSHALEPYMEPLVTCMVAGCCTTNFTSGRKAFAKFEDGCAPAVNAAFFTLTGAALSMGVLFGPVVVLVLILFLVRLFSIGVGSYAAGRASGDSIQHSRLSWMAYITQAGVALGLAKKVHVEYHTWGAEFATTMIAVVVINQLIGPPFFRFAIRQVGEAGKTEEWTPEAEAQLVEEDISLFDDTPVASAKAMSAQKDLL